MGKKRKASSPLQPSPPPTVTRIADQQHQFDRHMDELRQQMTSLQRRVEKLEMDSDCLQQRSRLPCLIFSGSAVPELSSPAEIPELLRGMIQDNMGYTLNTSAIKSSFRLRSGSIFVEFTSAVIGSDRDVIFR